MTIPMAVPPGIRSLRAGYQTAFTGSVPTTYRRQPPTSAETWPPWARATVILKEHGQAQRAVLWA
jgi:hypothetical protein